MTATSKAAQEDTREANKIIFAAENDGWHELHEQPATPMGFSPLKRSLRLEVDKKTQKISANVTLFQQLHWLSDKVKDTLEAEGKKYGIKVERDWSAVQDVTTLSISLDDYNKHIAPVLAQGRGRSS